jgi:hypothetical protein
MGMILAAFAGLREDGHESLAPEADRRLRAESSGTKQE